MPEPVYPTQLYEAAFLLILFAVCSYLLLKKQFRHNMTVYLIGYGIFRFLIEFIRGDDRGKLFGLLSPSQFWSLGMVILGVLLYFGMERVWRREAAAAGTEEKAAESSAPMQDGAVSADTDGQEDSRD